MTEEVLQPILPSQPWRARQACPLRRLGQSPKSVTRISLWRPSRLREPTAEPGHLVRAG
jgi:hypothetical protein